MYPRSSGGVALGLLLLMNLLSQQQFQRFSWLTEKVLATIICCYSLAPRLQTVWLDYFCFVQQLAYILKAKKRTKKRKSSAPSYSRALSHTPSQGNFRLALALIKQIYQFEERGCVVKQDLDVRHQIIQEGPPHIFSLSLLVGFYFPFCTQKVLTFFGIDFSSLPPGAPVTSTEGGKASYWLFKLLTYLKKI